MKEARIIMPIIAGSLMSVVAHDTMAKNLIKAFGGLTVYEGNGLWLDGETPVEDVVFVYDIACDEHKDATYDKLFELAVACGKLLDQKAVYIRYPDGEVEIADVNAKEHHTAPVKDCVSEPQPELVADDDGMGQAIGASLDRDAVFEAKSQPRRPRQGDIWRARNGNVAAILRAYPARLDIVWLTGRTDHSDTMFPDGRVHSNREHEMDLVSYESRFD